MSDEPSDALKLIAEVLKPLIYADMRYPDELFAQRRAEAYAAEVDKALGGLKAEKRILPQWRETGEVHNDRFFEGKPVPKTRLHYVQQSRWVSGWTVTE